MARKRKLDLGWAWKETDSTKPNNRLERRRLKRKQKVHKRRLLYAPGVVFYESKAWKALRRKVLETYGRKCMKCDAVNTIIQVDHIIPRSKRPRLSLTFSNLQVLCKACNIEKLNYHATDYRDEAATRELDLQAVSELRNWL
jgi:5-methylcytosine-specific restriction endonuclease McrA